MAKPTTQKKNNGDNSGLNFDAQLWAAAEQAVPAPHHKTTEYNCARPEGLCLGLIFLKYISDAFEETREKLLFGFSDSKSEWFIKDEPQRAKAADNRAFSLSASSGERDGVRCREAALPPAVYKPACEECSLFNICLPKATGTESRAGRLTRDLFIA
jgi:hypothetical protein